MSDQSNINMSVKEMSNNVVSGVSSGTNNVVSGVSTGTNNVISGVSSGTNNVISGVSSGTNSAMKNVGSVTNKDSNSNIFDVILKYLVIIPFTIVVLSLIIFFIIYINENKNKINKDNVVEYIIKYPDYVTEKITKLTVITNQNTTDVNITTKEKKNVNTKVKIDNSAKSNGNGNGNANGNKNTKQKTQASVTPPPPKPPSSSNTDPKYNVSNPTPDSVTSNTQTKKTKGGYCYIGEDRGYRSCVQVEDSNKCMSGEVFPNKDMCINANLR